MFLMLHELKSSQNGWEMGATLAWTLVVHGFLGIILSLTFKNRKWKADNLFAIMKII